MARIAIKNVLIMQTEPPFDVSPGDILIDGTEIIKAGPDAAEGEAADKIIDGKGRIAIPGNVCAHHHYYSGLSRGMLISAGPQTDFIQVLKEWWWRLDRALDEEALYYSSLICSMDAIAAGTTSAIDHHASPSFIKGSLSVIAKGMEEVGIRGATCYEVTDRNDGMKEVEEGVAENWRFADEVASKVDDALCQAMIGGHAPFTIPDEGLKLIAQCVEKTGCGMHLHVAEDKYDVIHSHHIYGKDIAQRLDDFGLLTPKTLLVHAVHLSQEEIELINKRGSFIAHNARSNMNNSIGYCTNLPLIKNLVLGTDGCGGNMFEEIKIAFFKNKDAKGPYWPADFLEALNRGNRIVENCFSGRGKWGRIAAGYKADIALLDYNAPTPLVKENAAGHFVWGMGSGCVDSVIVNGDIVYENHRFTKLDAERIYSEARRVAKRVWERADKIR